MNKPFISAINNGLNECFQDLETALQNLSHDELNWRPNLDSNNISWLVWHMARVEDNWVNIRLRHRKSLWERDGWAGKSGIEVEGNGWGQSSEDIRAMNNTIDVELMMQYYSGVRAETTQYFTDEMIESDLMRVVEHPSGDRSMDWNYSQVLGHLLAEEAQHLGQIAYLRGMIRGINN